MCHFKNDIDNKNDIDLSVLEKSRKSPRILITRTYSTESPGGSPILKLSRGITMTNTRSTANDSKYKKKKKSNPI